MQNIVEKYSAGTAVESEEGVVAIEYVLMAALVAVVVVGLATAFGGLGTRLQGVINTVIS
jgi:Flp pilus assembly pilin Flp